jgi:hypothetical protein
MTRILSLSGKRLITARTTLAKCRGVRSALNEPRHAAPLILVWCSGDAARRFMKRERIIRSEAQSL